jgi:signal transduction histidine kinase
VILFALPVGLVAGLCLVPGLFRAEVSQAGHYAAEGAFAAGCLVVAVLSLGKFRMSGSRRHLYQAAGMLALAASSLVFGIALPALGRSYADSSFPYSAWMAGWVVAAGWFLMGATAARRDPLEALGPVSAPVAALVVLAVVDAAAWAAEGAFPTFRLAALASDGLTPFELATAARYVAAAVAVALLGLAAWRLDRIPGNDPRGERVLTAMALLVGAGLQVVMLARPSAFRPVVQPADGWALVFVATMFAAALVGSRSTAEGLRRETDAAREVTRTRAELASMIAHELRNPLMSIKGLASTGFRLYDTMSDAERREFFGTIDDETGRLKDIVAQTSTALKIDAGELRYALRPESISTLVEEAVWTAGVRAHPVLMDVEPDLVAECDHGRIVEVIASLIDNADKYSPGDGQIAVRASRDGQGDVVVEVEDQGPGVPEEERQHVFEKYARYRPPGYQQVQGAGLGLFIARAHVEAHGGRIWLDSGAGGGTIVRFSLPGGGSAA